MRNFALFTMTLFFSMSNAEEKRVQCDTIDYQFRGLQTSYMHGETTIDSRGFLISSAKDRGMQQMFIGFKKKVFYLPENIDEKYPDIVHIWAQSSSIKSISNGVFDNLIALKELKLYNNQIEEIEGETFKDLKSLVELDLSDNIIKIVDEKAFKGLGQLKRLRLDDNQIEEIENNLFEGLKSLKILFLRDNKIKCVGAFAFKGLIQLNHLYLYNNQIGKIQNNLFEDLKSLEVLSLNDNKIKIVGRNAFKGLTQLKWMQLHSNQIERIENNLFADLKPLERLSMNDNKIKVVGENAFKGLTQLRILYLYNNQIEEIKINCFKDMKLLEELSLGENKIKVIDKNTFRGLIRLKKLWLHYNQIYKIENYLFEDLKSLEELYLAYNKIKIVNESTFKGLTQLKMIYMHINQIEIIEINLFEDLKSLEFLHLENNKIKFLNGKTFASMKNLTRVDLRANVCINRRFSSREEISELNEIVSNQCGYKEVFDFDCGKVVGPVGLVVGGSKAKYGQWPFLVSIAHLDSTNHFCGGSLITNQHVLTAAHCLQYKGSTSKLPVSKMIVNLGKYNLTATTEPNAVVRKVKAYHIHPDWKVYDVKWDADLVILVLDKPVEFSTVIQPVCLPLSWDKFETVDEGTAVGWGQSEFESRARPTEDIPRQSVVKVANDSYCYITDPDVARISSLRTFCAGGDGAGPCNGDSGGGLYTKIGKTWNLRGIISASLFNNDWSCNVNTFAVYTKVPDFFEWISNTIIYAETFESGLGTS